MLLKTRAGGRLPEFSDCYIHHGYVTFIPEVENSSCWGPVGAYWIQNREAALLLPNIHSLPHLCVQPSTHLSCLCIPALCFIQTLRIQWARVGRRRCHLYCVFSNELWGRKALISRKSKVVLLKLMKQHRLEKCSSSGRKCFKGRRTKSYSLYCHHHIVAWGFWRFHSTTFLKFCVLIRQGN